MNQVVLKKLLGYLKRNHTIRQIIFRTSTVTLAVFSPAYTAFKLLSEKAALKLFHGEHEAELQHMQSHINLFNRILSMQIFWGVK